MTIDHRPLTIDHSSHPWRRLIRPTFSCTLIFCLSLLFLTGCTRRAQPPVVPETAQNEGLAQESWDVALRISGNGQLRMSVEADYLARYERGDSLYTHLKPVADSGRVHVQFYDDLGRPHARLRAQEAYYFDQDLRFEARGDVQVQTRTGRRLTTEFLQWKEDERKIRTPGFVRLTTPTEQLQGYRLIADEDLETYTISRITGRVQIDEGF